MVKQSREFIQMEAFCLAPVLTLKWIQSLVLPSVASQGSPKGGERTGRKGWPLFFSNSLPLCWEKSVTELYPFCYPLVRDPQPYCRAPESACQPLASCCTSRLLNHIHMLQHRAVTDSHSFPAQGRNRPSKIALTKRFATPDSQGRHPPGCPASGWC